MSRRIQDAQYEISLTVMGGDDGTESTTFANKGYIRTFVGGKEVFAEVRGRVVRSEIHEVVKEVYRDPTVDEAVALLVATVKRSREPFGEAGRLLTAVTNGIVGVVREKEDR